MEQFVGMALIFAGSLWFLWSLYSLWKGRRSENWQTTRGIITRSEVTELSIRKGHGTCPIIHYQYTLDGQTYQSDRINWGNVHVSGAQEASEKICERYRTGSTVTVYYNPANASQSVLEPGAAPGAKLSLVVSCIPIVAGIIQLKTGFMKIR